ncbi:MAG TPA: D-alanyl-D-alanine carboxypeptidase family protein [Acidimicrobiia bacterium]|nr:D-alanyl-D-alanine carboxypeptidase family protein [Acidimicrobiia bacterium]
MESFAVAMSRVAEIRDRIMPPAPSGDFAAHLQRQLESPQSVLTVPTMERHVMTPAAPPTTTTTPTSGKNSPELEAFLQAHDVRGRNGRLEGTGLLVEVSGAWNGKGQLLAPAAKAWEQMRAAAAADGVDLKAIDMYRSYESQAAGYQAFLSGKKKANVLPPGKSEHGNGLAIDVTNGSLVGPGDPEWHWLNENAHRFGWYPISNESWHWEYRG